MPPGLPAKMLHYISMEKSTLETATFGAGCFWGVEELFRKVPGVAETAVGYMGGVTANPSYDVVSTDTTGHAEVVQVHFDSAKVPYSKLLDLFWDNHNPTSKNRQGPDIGSQYRSVIFYHTPEQLAAATASRDSLDASKKWTKPIVTAIEPAGKFHRAEEYHQRYFEKHGMDSCHI